MRHKGCRGKELFYPPFPKNSVRVSLYCQAEAKDKECLAGWEESRGPLGAYVDDARSEGIIAATLPGWRRGLKGRLENKDTLVGKEGAIPAALSRT